MAGDKRRDAGKEITGGIRSALHRQPDIYHGDPVKARKAVQEHATCMIVRAAEDDIARFQSVPGGRLARPCVYGYQGHAEFRFRDGPRVDRGFQHLGFDVTAPCSV